MPTQQLAEVELRVRAAIARQELEEAALLVTTYGALLESAMEAHRDDRVALQEIHDRAQSLFRWADRMARVIHQLASVQLGRLGVGTVYLAEAVRRESIRIRA